MRPTSVMQHAPHTSRPRFFVSTRGVLMERQASGAARRTSFSMDAHSATRSEMQTLAALCNEYAGAGIDALADLTPAHLEHLWALRCQGQQARHEAGLVPRERFLGAGAAA